LIGTDISDIKWHYSPYLDYFTEFDSFGSRLRHSGWR